MLLCHLHEILAEAGPIQLRGALAFHRGGRGARGEEMILIDLRMPDFSALSAFSAVNDSFGTVLLAISQTSGIATA